MSQLQGIITEPLQGEVVCQRSQRPGLHTSFSVCNQPFPSLASIASGVCEYSSDRTCSSEGFSVFLTGGYVEALEVTKETPGRGAFKPSSISEVTYDDVEYPRRKE